MAQLENQDQWLVRTAKNVISGPFSRAQVQEMVLSGKLNLQDEVCKANTYWIYLHEQDEVKRQLEVEVPQAVAAKSDDEEITDTQTNTYPDMLVQAATAHAEAITAAPAPTIIRASSASSSPEVVPELVDPSIAQTENTAVISNRALREFQARKARQSVRTNEVVQSLSSQAPRQPHVHILSGIERPSFWRGFAWALIVAACFIVVMVLRLLRER